MLAWVRTAMSFISFGFAMIKVLESLASGPIARIKADEANNIGLFLMFVGTVPLAVGMYQFYQMAGRLGQKPARRLANPSFGLAVVILLLGVVLFFNVTLAWHLL